MWNRYHLSAEGFISVGNVLFLKLSEVNMIVGYIIYFFCGWGSKMGGKDFPDRGSGVYVHMKKKALGKKEDHVLR